MEAQNPANATLTLGAQQSLACFDRYRRRIGHQRRVIVGEGEDARVWRILIASGPCVAGAKIAGGVIVLGCSGVGFAYLALPGTLGTVGRNQHPAAAERVEAAMRKLHRIVHFTCPVTPLPSSTVKILSTAGRLNFSLRPLGQWISTESTLAASPRPKCTRGSLEETKLPPLRTSPRCRRPPAVR